MPRKQVNEENYKLPGQTYLTTSPLLSGDMAAGEFSRKENNKCLNNALPQRHYRNCVCMINLDG